MKKYSIALTFTRPILGSQPSDHELRRKYIAAKMITGKTGMSGDIAMAKVEGEIENLKKDEEYTKKIEETGEKGLTVFYRDDNGQPAISDIQIRGFIKDAFAFVAKDLKIKDLQKKDGGDYKGEQKYRDWIGERISFDRQYYPFSGDIGYLERPIRVNIPMQGPRVSIAGSELCKNPSRIDFTIMTTEDLSIEILKAILDRGMFKGISQWSNAQYGCFTYIVNELSELKEAA